MNKYFNFFKGTILLLIAGWLLNAGSVSAQTTLAKWTFETSQPGINPGAGNWITNLAAETGSGTASARHAAAITYSSPAGNGSSHCFSAANWAVGDVFQFATSTIGFTNINVSFDQNGSPTGPRDFSIFYSTNGVSFTQLAGSSYQVLTNAGATLWSASGAVSGTTFSFNFSSVAAVANASVVYFRLVDGSTTSINAGIVGTSGTSRIDNFAVTGTVYIPPVSPIPLNIQRNANSVTLNWTDPSFSLQSSTNVTGPYSAIAAAAGQMTYIDGTSNQAKFYRLQHP